MTSLPSSAAAAEKITRSRLDDIRSLGLTALIYYSGSGALAGRRVLQLAGCRIPAPAPMIRPGVLVRGKMTGK